MKNIGKIMILMIVSLFAFGVNALNVEITNVELSSKTEYVEEVSSPTIDGTNINLNIRFKDEEQKIVYKIDIKNNTKSDVVLDTSFDNNIIKYTLKDFEGNSIKANSTRTIYLELYYKDEIDESLYSNKLYTASSTFKFMLSGQNGLVKGVLENPKTGVFTYSLIVVILIGVFGAIFMFSKSKNVFKHFVIAFLLIVPTFVIADTVFNTTVDGTTTMEFIEPKRAILDVGETVNTKMHDMAGDVMPAWVESTPGSGLWHHDPGDTTHIKHIVRSETLNSNNAEEIQFDDSDYKIWMWYDNGTIYYYSDEALIYFNQDSSKFFYYLSGLEEFDSFYFFHAKYLRNASYMFANACGNIDGDFNFKLNIKTKYVENMGHMFYYFRTGANGTGNSSFELGELFTLDNCTSAEEMFMNAFDGENGNTGNFTLTLSDNFNACKVEYAGYMFSFMAQHFKDVTINLGNGFNLESATNAHDFFYQTASSATGDVKIDCGDNFNGRSITNAYALFYGIGSTAANIDINMGKNFNLQSAKQLNSMFYGTGYNMNGGTVNINYGDNFNACGNVETIQEGFWGFARGADKINIDFGKNYNLENCPEIRHFMESFNSSAKEVNIDFGDNFNCKNTTRIECFIGDFCQNLPSDGVVNINFGKNFNAEKLQNVHEFLFSIGCNSKHGNINVDFGENFNCNNIKMLTMFVYNVYADNINIDFKDSFTLNNAETIKWLFEDVSGSESIKVDFGMMNFNIESADDVENLFCNFAEDSNRVELANFSSISFPNATVIDNIFNNFGTNSTFVDDFTIDLSGFVINTENFQYEDWYSPDEPRWPTTSGLHIIKYGIPDIKIKVHNNTIGTSGKTLKEFILADNEGASESIFITV